ncbi:MAG: ATP-binding protein [Planctomycetaceae bacterium]
MTLIERIKHGRQPMPPRLIVYGTEGIGKSTFASEAPKPVFIQTEDGLAEIACDKFPLATRLEDVQTALLELYSGQHDYQTVVIDSLDWLERLIWDELCRQHNVTSIEKVDGGFAKGYTHALSHWRAVLDSLNRLRSDRGMVVICVSHSKIEKFEDPETSAYDRYSPRLNKHAQALVCEWSDAVLFASRKFRTQTEDAGFGRKRAIAAAVGAGGGERIMRCVGGPCCIAKNRYRLPEELPLKWAAFMNAIFNSQDEEKLNG